ncbi:MAG: CTP synthase [Caldisericaceae bacterium]
MKFIFVTGGVISSLGKGLVASSLGLLMKARGYSVNLVKVDPYLQIDAGTMSPYEHGEVFVTEDGGETDLDIGNYERFLNVNLSSKNSITTGKVYFNVLTKERKGEYLGKTVQVIPHITDEIKTSIKEVAQGNEITIVEIGGTVGDIESQPFLEAIRQMRKDYGKENVLYVHVSLLPYVKATDELKTKPTQHSVKELRSIGIQPDFIVLRSEIPVSNKVKEKISLFCDVDDEAVIEALDVRSIYEIPIGFERNGFGGLVLKRLSLPARKAELGFWEDIVRKVKSPEKEVNIGIIGKYIEMKDAYKSLTEALIHGGIANNTRVNLHWINAAELEHCDFEEILDNLHKLGKIDGILVPGGFGIRGIEGMINAISYARTKNIPFLGICLGLQCAVIEFARNVCGLENANSTEFDEKTPYPVIDIMQEQRNIHDKGGTMRLGSFPAHLEEGSLVKSIYGAENVSERHRHRYEVNNHFRETLVEHGLSISGTSPDGKLVEFIEIKAHRFFVATQAHPEFKSRPSEPHPLFKSFIEAAFSERE